MSRTSSVELRGLEPLTPCMPCRCATSCATAPNCPAKRPREGPSSLKQPVYLKPHFPFTRIDTPARGQGAGKASLSGSGQPGLEEKEDAAGSHLHRSLHWGPAGRTPCCALKGSSGHPVAPSGARLATIRPPGSRVRGVSVSKWPLTAAARLSDIPQIHPTNSPHKKIRRNLSIPADYPVELRGLEPLTPCMPCRCATSCATAPNFRCSGPVSKSFRFRLFGPDLSEATQIS